MDLSWDYFHSSLQAKTHFWPQKQQIGYVGFQEKFNAPPTQTNQAQFEKLNSPPTELGMLFPAHLQLKKRLDSSSYMEGGH